MKASESMMASMSSAASRCCSRMPSKVWKSRASACMDSARVTKLRRSASPKRTSTFPGVRVLRMSRAGAPSLWLRRRILSPGDSGGRSIMTSRCRCASSALKIEDVKPGYSTTQSRSEMACSTSRLSPATSRSAFSTK
ncbi:PP173 [Orf virus]|uniref:PP173 n=1 Tax=Orf virus TaxID=10258 RepID=F1AX07_ORFV|nr:PP173 [Orf virus]